MNSTVTLAIALSWTGFEIKTLNVWVHCEPKNFLRWKLLQNRSTNITDLILVVLNTTRSCAQSPPPVGLICSSSLPFSRPHFYSSQASTWISVISRMSATRLLLIMYCIRALYWANAYEHVGIWGIIWSRLISAPHSPREGPLLWVYDVVEHVLRWNYSVDCLAKLYGPHPPP